MVVRLYPLGTGVCRVERSLYKDSFVEAFSFGGLGVLQFTLAYQTLLLCRVLIINPNSYGIYRTLRKW